MSKARFPSTPMILPEFRHVFRKHENVQEPVVRIKNRQEFQRLIELSLQNGIVLQLYSNSENMQVRHMTTGIIKHINPHTSTLVVQTLEGPRFIKTADICDVMSFE